MVDPPLARRDGDMGMTAQVLSIGPFRRDLARHLHYPPDLYAGTQEGVTVVSVLFECFGSTQSRELAACFGIDPWDFNQHRLDPHAVDLARLRALYSLDGGLIEAFLALREAGFAFHFMPNG
jgi:hypothetical protein